MSRHHKGRFCKQSKNKTIVGDQARETIKNIDENSTVIQMFSEFKKELDEKHDRYEKIVKISRDITIESKRIIFLLHNVNTDIEERKTAVLEDAKSKLNQLIEKNFKTIAQTLQQFDSYQYHRAYTNGLQEFIEAFVFYQFLAFDDINSWELINKSFIYEDNLHLLFPQTDYILGIADFTGELMRRCINNLGIGNVNECFKICNFVKYLNTGYLGLINPGIKELGRKIYVLKTSLCKMELVCYNIQIRGSEIPKHMLVSVIEATNDMNSDEDEGYF